MKNIILFSFLLTILIGCRNNKSESIEKVETNTEPKSIEYEINRNLITFRIAHNLIKENRQWSSRPNPVRDDLFEYFSDYQNHEVLNLIKNTGGDDVISLYLLHKQEFPKFGDKYKISQTNKKYELNDSTQLGLDPKWNLLYTSLYDFYRKANVENFIKEHLYYYEGAISEISGIAKEFDLIGKMEEYTNQFNDRYVISPEPLFITGGWRGIGPNVQTEKISIAYQFISPSDKIDLSNFSSESLQQFGYNDKDFIRNLCVHEFGHSFVNSSFYQDKISIYIENKESLLTNEIKENIRKNGIGNFTVYLIEHVVRLLEIRIVEIYFSKEEAQKIRDENKNFIYLSKMEKKLIDDFEKNRDKYATYSDFIPELVRTIE